LKHRTDKILVCITLLFSGLSGLTLPGWGPLDEAWGVIFGIIAATSFGLLALHRWTLRRERMFVHGYHAGFHDATKRPCTFTELNPSCDVLDLSESRAQRLIRSG
jgi:hypothetical protein